MDMKAIFEKTGTVNVLYKGVSTNHEWKSISDRVTPFSILAMPIEIEEGTTLGQFLSYFIDSDQQFRNIVSEILLVAAGTDYILFKMGHVARKNSERDKGIDYVEVYFNGIDIGQKENSYHGWLGFHGVGKDAEDPTNTLPYAVEFRPISDYWDTPIRINRRVPVYEIIDPHKRLGEIDIYPTVLDVLYAIIYEMTFFGVIDSPEQSRKKMDEILGHGYTRE